jgi:hypothetical protein
LFSLSRSRFLSEAVLAALRAPAILRLNHRGRVEIVAGVDRFGEANVFASAQLSGWAPPVSAEAISGSIATQATAREVAAHKFLLKTIHGFAVCN